jgi:hypothetical protein
MYAGHRSISPTQDSMKIMRSMTVKEKNNFIDGKRVYYTSSTDEGVLGHYLQGTYLLQQAANHVGVSCFVYAQLHGGYFRLYKFLLI